MYSLPVRTVDTVRAIYSFSLLLSHVSVTKLMVAHKLRVFTCVPAQISGARRACTS